MVTLAFIVSEKTPGQTDKKTYKQTREPLSKGDSHTGLIAFHIQIPQIPLHVDTLASLPYFIHHTSE